jgi:glutamate dehydrogenase
MRLREAGAVTQHTGTSGAPAGTSGRDTWAEELLAAARPDTRELAADLADRAPASYRERTSASQAAIDATELRAVLARGHGDGSDAPPSPNGHHRFVVRPLPDGRFHIRRIAERPVELTALLPVLESFGLVVEESVPYRFVLGEGSPVCIDDIGVHLDTTPDGSPVTFDVAADGPRLVDALDAVIAGRTEIDRLNALVPAAGLEWRQVSLLRAYVNYWAQCSPVVPHTDVEVALLSFPSVTRRLVEYFTARFDPGRRGSPGPDDDAPTPKAETRAACTVEVGKVPLLRWDRALRVVLSLIDATLRTNYFQARADGGPQETVTFKLESAAVPKLPYPRPRVETWVHAPSVEGIHLRAGLVARGGIRWSERPEDFRTEVLDLMVAQVKKNAIIVPTGAKGGFVVRRTLPDPAAVRSAYATFVGSLLDITDNLAGGDVLGPPGVVAHDGADPYLVVAADKGTADLSDLANEISAAHGFWLGDAFASGGSHGYNHKQMGITARGAWVAVRRHFHQLGIDVQREAITVAGVGDMSGDVFGNGMLLSESIRLVAAFDHRHVFLDPDPDPAASYAERKRLASLPRSSWADYDAALLSPGGGVWPRGAKLIPLTPEARQALGVDRDEMSPPELLSAILEAPVDLLWFGGVGTFVRAPEESDADVGDHANDEVRVTSDRLRARVVGEGGNLGLTQRARIRYSRRGGRINTDFIDNAAGVATSDREVNLKILLALAAEEGRLAPDARESYLARAEMEVAREVLRQVDHSVAALGRAVPDSAGRLDAYSALIDTLESGGLFQREVESLPAAEELARRRAAGAGMIRPELAVLLAYAKSDLGAALDGAPFLRDSSLSGAVESYFPAPMRADFGDLVPRHRLYEQILATELAGEIVDRLGIVWAHETAAELARGLADVAASYWAAREVIDASPYWSELDELWSNLPADAETRLHDELAGAAAELARTYLRRDRSPRPGTLAALDVPVADALSATAPDGDKVAALAELGVDREMAERWLRAAARSQAADVGLVVRATGRHVGAVSAAFAQIDEAVGVGRMAAALRHAPVADRWRGWLARATLDDLADWRVETVSEVVADGVDATEAVARWSAEHDGELAGARRLLAALETPDTDPTTIVAVALRRLPRPRPPSRP